jgi:hypothetical protein
VNDPARDVVALCEALESMLNGDGRARILDSVARKGGLDDALRRLRTHMSAHGFEGLGPEVGKCVRRMDQRTRQDGFRVLHAWNHQTHAFTEDIVPVLLLDFFERAKVQNSDVRVTLAILLDWYFLHLLSLCAMRAWDTADPGDTLDRVTALVAALQGERGSGHRFVTDAETLLIYGLSQFHPDEHAYDRIIERVATLSERHQVDFARVSAAVLGAHLRWGLWLMYGRDVGRMRQDNVGDYPWLLYSVRTLLRAWADRLEGGKESESGAQDQKELEHIREALLLGLAADPWAFTGRPPPALVDHAGEHEEVRVILRTHGARLLNELESVRPQRDRYAPLSLHFNFPHNAVVAAVTLALLEGRPQSLPLNALFEADRGEAHGGDTQADLARALTAFSRGSPDRLGHRGAMLVAYDPLSAMRSYAMTVEAVRKSLGEG